MYVSENTQNPNFFSFVYLNSSSTCNCASAQCIFVFLISLCHFPFSANHRRAGHAVTNILAKELMQEDTTSSSKSPKKKAKSEKEEPKLEDAESLEELLDPLSSRSS